MTTGTVKWFNPDKGFGFIEPEDGSKDAFVHISAVERAGMSSLSEGQAISYELQPGQNGKSSAENLKDPSDDAADDHVDDVTEDAVNDDVIGDDADDDAEDTDDDTDDESEKDAEVNE